MVFIPLEQFVRENDPLEAGARRTREGKVFLPIGGGPAPRDEPGIVSSSLSRGVQNVGADFSAAGGLAAEAFGFDEVAEGFFNKAEEFANSAQAIPKRVARVEDIRSAGDLGVFALETLLENAPLLASIAIPGLATAKAVSFAGGSAHAARVAGTAGAFLSDVGLQTGESTQIATEAGVDPNDIRIIGAGIGKAALDFVPILTVARRLGLSRGLVLGETVEREIGKQLVERGFLRRIPGNVGTILATEIPTEVTQEIINISLDRSLRQFEGQITEEEKSQLLNAAAGAAAFGLLGIPVSIARPQDTVRPATDDELQEGSDAAATPAEVAQLPGPSRPLALPAPADFTVSNDGIVVPFGQEIEPVTYDPGVDTPTSPNALRDAIRKELNTEQPTVDEIVFIVGEDGIATPQLPDSITTEALLISRIPEGERTPTQQTVVRLDTERAATVIQQSTELPAGDAVVADPRMEKLIALHDEILGNEENRRRTDGQLKARPAKRLANLETKIDLLAKRMGVPNPFARVAHHEVTSDVEKQVPAINKEAAQRQAQPVFERLTDTESTLLERLEEKDIFEGLSAREEGIRERLIAKREGELEATREPVTAKDRSELKALALEAVSDETVRLREGSQKAGPVTVDRGAKIAQAFSRKLQRGPEIVVVDSTHKGAFPPGSARQRNIAGGKGAFFAREPNRIYIFPDRATSEVDFARTLFHETMAHFGLRAYLSPEELTSFLTRTYETRSDQIITRFGVPESATQARKFAEEYIASIAENGTDKSFLNRVIALIRRAVRKVLPSLGKISDNDIRAVLRDVSKFLSGEIGTRNPVGIEAHMSNGAFLRAVGEDVMEGVLPQMDSFKKVWGAKFANGVLTPLQIAERSGNIPGVTKYIEQVQLWWARKRNLTFNPANIAEEWQKMPKRDAQRLSEFIFRLNELSDELGEKLDVNPGTTDQRVIDLARETGMTEHAMKMYRKIDASFVETLDQLQNGLEKAAIRQATRDAVAAEEKFNLWKSDKRAFIQNVAKDPQLENLDLAGRLTEIENEMAVLRNRNYFPRMRFGPYSVIVRAKKDLDFEGKSFTGPTQDRGGEVVHYETFESLAARRARKNSLAQEFSDTDKYEISFRKVADEEFSFLGMPPALFKALEQNLELSKGQQEQLKELYFRYSPGKRFLRHLTRRKGVPGYSTDAMRVYASYMMNASNHIARVEFSDELGSALNEMEAGVKQLREGTRADEVKSYFARHFNYIMNPENDLAKYRAMGFLWYLGFNVKSAFVNLTQVPMVAYPFLSHHYGDTATIGALMRSYNTVTQKSLGKTVLDVEADKDLERAIREGFVDESRATELAGIGESTVLQRLMPEDASTRLINNVSFYGAFLFRHAEKFNREVVFLAARELAIKRGQRGEEVFKAGRKAVQATMFEYAKWNRPAFMRGKPSVFFLFWQYMQHLSFMAFGGEGKGPALRVWLMLMMAAGLQGLPFAENFFDIFDFGATEIREALGVKDPRVDLRSDLRELAGTLTDQPDLVMHGLARYYGLGPVHLLALFGAPVPQTDITGSLSAGRVIPGTADLLGNERNPDKKFGRTMAEVLGPVVGMGYGFWKALESDDPDKWKVWERALPTALQGASKSLRRSSLQAAGFQGRGEETFRGGGSVAEFDPHNSEQRAENIAQALGFATTRVNQRFELRASQESLKQYWTTRRAMVMENFAYALMSQDQEAIADARRALVRFNKEIPSPALAIRRDSLTKSIKQRFKRAELREQGIPNEKAFQFLYKRQEEQFGPIGN